METSVYLLGLRAKAEHVVWGGARRQASLSLPHSRVDIRDLHFIEPKVSRCSTTSAPTLEHSFHAITAGSLASLLGSSLPPLPPPSSTTRVATECSRDAVGEA